MLTIITKNGIVSNPWSIRVCSWADITGVSDSAPTTKRYLVAIVEGDLYGDSRSYAILAIYDNGEAARQDYNRIADQVAAGVKVIDLRKMINEEGEAK